MGRVGVQEQQVKKRVRIGNFQKTTLSVIGAAGLLLVAVAAPNTLSLLKKALNRRNKFHAKSVLQKLAERNLISFVNRDGKRYVKLTAAGEAFLGRMRSYAVPRPRVWDGKWRIVSFDIAQARSALRSRLRQTLQEIGFERLQDSVWVFPYDCEDLIVILKADYGLGKEVLYIIADSIENDRALRHRFGLRKK